MRTNCSSKFLSRLNETTGHEHMLIPRCLPRDDVELSGGDPLCDTSSLPRIFAIKEEVFCDKCEIKGLFYSVEGWEEFRNEKIPIGFEETMRVIMEPIFLATESQKFVLGDKVSDLFTSCKKLHSTIFKMGVNNLCLS